MRIFLGLFFMCSFFWLMVLISGSVANICYQASNDRQQLHNNITYGVWHYYKHDLQNPVDTSLLLDLDTVKQAYLDTLEQAAGRHFFISADAAGTCGYLVMMNLVNGKGTKSHQFPVILLDKEFHCRYIFDSTIVRPKHCFSYRAGCR